MNTAVKLLGLLALSLGMNLAMVDDSEARRLGGARSIGAKPPVQRSVAPRTPTQTAAAAQNQQVRQQLAQRGGMMGLLGGLALGGLLGALLFGGAFENLNILDLLLFAGIGYLLFRLLAARQRSAAQPASGTAPAPDAQAPGTAAFGSGSAPRGQDGRGLAMRPEGFDEDAFLDGARRAFELLQRSWNEQDLAEIRGLTTDALFAELQDQARAPDAEAFVEVLKVDAELVDVRDAGERQEASVLFGAILREGEHERPAQVRELWHFVRPAGALAPRWYLDGIEQLEG